MTMSQATVHIENHALRPGARALVEAVLTLTARYLQVTVIRPGQAILSEEWGRGPRRYAHHLEYPSHRPLGGSPESVWLTGTSKVRDTLLLTGGDKETLACTSLPSEPEP